MELQSGTMDLFSGAEAPTAVLSPATWVEDLLALALEGRSNVRKRLREDAALNERVLAGVEFLVRQRAASYARAYAGASDAAERLFGWIPRASEEERAAIAALSEIQLELTEIKFVAADELPKVRQRGPRP